MSSALAALTRSTLSTKESPMTTETAALKAENDQLKAQNERLKAEKKKTTRVAIAKERLKLPDVDAAEFVENAPHDDVSFAKNVEVLSRHLAKHPGARRAKQEAHVEEVAL